MGEENSKIGLKIGTKFGIKKKVKEEAKKEEKKETKKETKKEAKKETKKEEDKIENNVEDNVEDKIEDNVEDFNDEPNLNVKIEDNVEDKIEDDDEPKDIDIDDEKIENVGKSKEDMLKAENYLFQKEENDTTDVNTLYILLNPFKKDIKQYEIKITPELSLKEIKNQLVNEHNISFDEFSLYSKNEDLSENCDDKLLDKIFKTDEKKELYLYNKSELYEINIKHNESSSVLKIHDSMKIENILKMFVIKYNLVQDRYTKYYLVSDGVTLNGAKEASFYKLKGAKSITLEEISFTG